MEFKAKICFDSEECIDAVNINKQDDIFQIAEYLPSMLSVQDVNQEVLDVNAFDQIEYLLTMKDEVEL